MNIEALAQLMGSDDENEREGDGLTDVQIVNRLTECAARLDETTKFENGDIILHKWPGLATTKNAHKPKVFLEYLDQPVLGHTLPDAEVGTHTIASVEDCRVGQISQGCFVRYLADSREFELHPDFKKSDAPMR